MSVSDAEKAYYESIIANPDGKTLADLRLAYFLAALDGGLPGGSGTVQGITPGTNISVDNTDPAHPVVSATVPDDVVTSPNASITGIAYYPNVGALPGTGQAGVLYVVDQ